MLNIVTYCHRSAAFWGTIRPRICDSAIRGAPRLTVNAKAIIQVIAEGDYQQALGIRKADRIADALVRPDQRVRRSGPSSDMQRRVDLAHQQWTWQAQDLWSTHPVRDFGWSIVLPSVHRCRNCAGFMPPSEPCGRMVLYSSSR